MEKLIKKFNEQIKPALGKSLEKKNIFQIPSIEKVVVSAGIGDYKDDDKAIEKIADELSKIVGQKVKINLSKKAVSSFKLRIGQSIGLTATLRKEKMYDFIDRLINISLPRVRDFRGLPEKGFDGKGNYSLGIKDRAIFPEIKYEEAGKAFGLQVNIKTTAENDEDAKALLIALGFPFEKKEKK